MEKKTMTVKEFADYGGFGLQTAYNITHREDFYPLLKIGRKRLILTHLLDKWLEEQAGQKEA